MKGDPDPEARVAASFYLGRNYASERDTARAMEEYRLAAYSKVACAYRLYAVFGLAQLAAQTGDRAYAVALLESMLKSNPGAVEAELAIAEALLDLGRAAEAKRHYDSARASTLRIFPNGEEPWEKRARERLERAFAPQGRRRRRIGAAIPVLNEWRFMPAVVGQLLQVCDRVVVLRGLRALSGAPVEIGPMPKLDPRVEVVEGAWAGEGETRNAGMERLGDCDYTWMVDSDEILLDRDVLLLRDLCDTQDLPAIGVKLLTYWKTPEYRIDPPERLIAQIVARKGIRVQGLRSVQAPVTVANLWCRHLSYVRTDEEVKEKLRLFSHATEILPEWYENVWKAWDLNPALENLHPTHPAAYRRAVFDPDPELNAVLARWGCAWTSAMHAR
jgi:tetratricopeptide (TPR) repeat protein